MNLFVLMLCVFVGWLIGFVLGYWQGREDNQREGCLKEDLE